jgi:hypothetical protein
MPHTKIAEVHLTSHNAGKLSGSPNTYFTLLDGALCKLVKNEQTNNILGNLYL